MRTLLGDTGLVTEEGAQRVVDDYYAVMLGAGEEPKAQVNRIIRIAKRYCLRHTCNPTPSHH